MEVAELPRARQPPTLPMDLLLEIIARSDDVTTVVRCAAGCKPLRRAMLHQGFLDRLRRRAEANGGFDPSLLMAVSYRLHAASSNGTDSIVVVQPPGRIRLDADLLPPLGSTGSVSYKTASSCDGLLVVLGGGILVCNTITGHVTSLPSKYHLRGTASFPREMYGPALLTVDGAGRSFELLVMYKEELHGRLLTQTFSSREGDWGAARQIHFHSVPPVLQYEASSTAPAIVGRSVHWLCSRVMVTQLNNRELSILALDAESAHASVIKLPQELLSSMGPLPTPIVEHAETRILATTATTEREKRLSLVVVEAFVISMWTLVPEAAEGSSISWSRQVVIRGRDMPLTSVLDAYQPIRLSMFGERSGTLLYWMQGIGLVQLNLGTKKALVLWRGSDTARARARAFLHEMNLISILECMKSF